MKKKLQRTFSDFFDFSKSSRTAFTIVVEIIGGAVAILGSLIIFLKLADNILEQEVFFFDSGITGFIYMFRSDEMTTFMKFITGFGGEIIIGSAIIATIVFLLRHHKKDAFIFSFILFFGILLNFLLKLIFGRPRPDLFPLIHETTYSFPSGHAMNSFVFYMALSYFIFHNTHNRALGFFLTIGSILLILLIGISRIYLGVHYPSDILAGYVAGLLWFGIILMFEKTLIFLRLFHEYELKKKY